MNVYEIVNERIMALLAKGTAPWRMPWSPGATEPKNLVSGKGYRGINVLLLGTQGYVSPYWLTFKQALDRGGSVRKGEKGTPVTFFKSGKDEDTKKGYFVLRYFTAFNVAQCDGIEAPATPGATHAHEKIEACEGIVKAYPGRPQIIEGERACYSSLTDTVTVPALARFAQCEEYYCTLFHELGHSTGAAHRLERDMGNMFGSHAYSFEELIAEITAAFLCGRAGIDTATIENSAAYLASWHRKLKSEPKWMVQAAGKASKAADYILNVKRDEESAAA